LKLPDVVRDRVQASLGVVGECLAIGGGCVSSASRIMVEGEPVFLKFERDAPAGFFEAEAAGLEVLRAGDELRVPRVIGRDEDDDDGWSWLAMEWLEAGPASTADDEALGRGLARLHRRTAPEWGASRNGFIGRLPQSNRQSADWAAFWWAERLLPQLRTATGIGIDESWKELERRLPELLAAADADGPSLLHGDLWSGNVVWSTAGPALVDPSSYHGHREVDLAMMELFGGFPQRSFQAYREAWPLQSRYDARKLVYQLYYLLVHVNLFGASYVPRTLQTLRRVVEHA
jgi:fructosamine-3-kinase